MKPIAAAKEAGREFLEAEVVLREVHNQHLVLAHRFGEKLSALKENVPPGGWNIYVCANFPELGLEDSTRLKNADRSMRLFNANQNLQNPSTFEAESVRKFWYYYVPKKERPPLAGDERIHPAPHYLTFVNNFNKWRYRVRNGHIESPPLETLRHDFRPVIKRISELCGGLDWLR